MHANELEFDANGKLIGEVLHTLLLLFLSLLLLLLWFCALNPRVCTRNAGPETANPKPVEEQVIGNIVDGNRKAEL